MCCVATQKSTVSCDQLNMLYSNRNNNIGSSRQISLKSGTISPLVFDIFYLESIFRAIQLVLIFSENIVPLVSSPRNLFSAMIYKIYTFQYEAKQSLYGLGINHQQYRCEA